jgi:hypothetical protein
MRPAEPSRDETSGDRPPAAYLRGPVGVISRARPGFAIRVTPGVRGSGRLRHPLAGSLTVVRLWLGRRAEPDPSRP